MHGQPSLQEWLADELHVAPLIAADIIAHAEKHDLRLVADGGRYQAYRAYIHWCDAQTLTL